VSIDISALERETGISKDTLRVWERRYGFPRPLRDANGERTYPLDQLARLRSIRRLIDSGLRPGRVLRATDSELAELLRQVPGSAGTDPTEPGPVRDLAALLERRDMSMLQSRLTSALLQLGVRSFVTEIAAPLTTLVGELWQTGRIAVAEEHRYSEILQQLLRSAMRTDPAVSERPRILLTTLPGEPHGLGLLMVQAWLAGERVHCVSLGTQTPATEVAGAALAYRVDVVGLSFSRIHTPNAARKEVGTLRAILDASIAVWAGGSLWQHARKQLPGVEYIVDFSDLAAAIKRWH
jgi:DNA-binding transcriptional MerR regulator/methylmalonyl-CoA mutase cobalamin-binding subunit